MRQQVQRWENDGILAEAEPSKRRLLYLLAGDLPRFFEMKRSWLEVLGGLLWYTPKRPLDETLRAFLEMAGKTDLAGKDGLLFGLLRVAAGDASLAGILNSQLAGVSNRSDGNPSDLVNTIHETVDETSKPVPANSPAETPAITQWLVALLLQAFRPIDACAETPVLPSLAEEAVAALRQTGHWEWAIFVAIFDVSSSSRRWRVREILARHIDGVSARVSSVIGDVLKEPRVAFLVGDLNIAETVVYSVMADLAAGRGDGMMEVVCRLQAREFEEAFATLMKRILPVAIEKEDVEMLVHCLALFEGKEGEVRKWEEEMDVVEEFAEQVKTFSQDEQQLANCDTLLRVVQTWRKVHSSWFVCCNYGGWSEGIIKQCDHSNYLPLTSYSSQSNLIR